MFSMHLSSDRNDLLFDQMRSPFKIVRRLIFRGKKARLPRPAVERRAVNASPTFLPLHECTKSCSLRLTRSVIAVVFAWVTLVLCSKSCFLSQNTFSPFFWRLFVFKKRLMRVVEPAVCLHITFIVHSLIRGKTCIRNDQYLYCFRSLLSNMRQYIFR